MRRILVLALSLLATSAAYAHSDSKFIKGPHGGHIVDAGGGKQHWELVANGSDLVLYVTDSQEKPVDTAGGAATAQVLLGGKTTEVQLKPDGENKLKGTGGHTSAKGMKVVVKTTNVGGQSMQARLTPMQ